MTSLISAGLQVAGLAAVALGVALIYAPAGLIVAGLGSLAVGVTLGLPPRRRK